MKAWISEADFETHFMEGLAPLGYALWHGADVSPETRHPLRASFRETILAPVLLDNLQRLNPDVPVPALEDAVRRVTDPVFATDLAAPVARNYQSDFRLVCAVDGADENAPSCKSPEGRLRPTISKVWLRRP